MTTYGEHNPYYLSPVHLALNTPVVARLYKAASTLRPATKSMPNLDGLLNQLQEYLNSTIVQAERVRDLSETSIHLQVLQQRSLPSLLSNSSSDFNYLGDELWLTNELLFKDIHYFVIAVDKFQKLWNSLTTQLFTGDTIELLSQANSNLSSALDEIGFERLARNFLEHLEERISTGKFSGFESRSDQWVRSFKISGTDHVINVTAEPLAQAFESLCDQMRHLMTDIST